MKKSNILLFAGILALSLACLLSGCGGGGADTSRSGGTNATLTQNNASSVGDAVTQAVKLVVPATAVGEVKAGGVSAGNSAPLISVFQNVAPAIGKQAGEKRSSSTTSCSGGGNIDVGIPTPVSADHVKVDVTVNSCTINNQTMNGAMTVTVPLSALADLKHVDEFTIEASSFTYSDKHSSISFTDNFTIMADHITYSGDTITGGSLVMGGTVSGSIDGYPVRLVCDSLAFQFSSDASGLRISVSGGLSASCFGGHATLRTNQQIFLPASGGCPTAGDISVTDVYGSIVRVVFNSDTTISVFYNGTLIQTYENCSKVLGLCSV